MNRHGMPRPDWTGFSARLIADGENEVHVGAALARELIPVLGTKTFGRIIQFFQQGTGMGIYFSSGMAARAEGLKGPGPDPIEDCFCKNASRRIAGAQEEYSVWPGIHVGFMVMMVCILYDVRKIGTISSTGAGRINLLLWPVTMGRILS